MSDALMSARITEKHRLTANNRIEFRYIAEGIG